MRPQIALMSLLASSLALNAFAVGNARFTGKVVDTEGKPVNASIKVVATQAKTFKETFKTDKKGKFAIFLLDGTIPYEFTWEAEGYQGYKEEIKLKLVPEKNDRTITLRKPSAAAAAAPVVTAEKAAKADPAVTAFNAGVDAMSENRIDEAISKFQEAVTLNPALDAGYKALARVYTRKSDWPKAIAAADKALVLSPDDPDMLTVLANAYDKSGNKAKAAEYRKKAPANPTELFNDAARMINAQNDAAAEPLLKQAIAADPQMARAYYELGLVYARLGRNAEARVNLEKYIQMDPKGKDAATAKEMLQYVK